MSKFHVRVVHMTASNSSLKTSIWISRASMRVTVPENPMEARLDDEAAVEETYELLPSGD